MPDTIKTIFLLLCVTTGSVVLAAPARAVPVTSRPEKAPAIVQNGELTVRADDLSTARQVAREARENLRRIYDDILPAGQLPSEPVAIYVWNNPSDYRSAAPHAPADSTGCTLSHVNSQGQRSHRIDLLDQNPVQSVLFDRQLPHELCHVVQSQFFDEEHSLDQNTVPLAVREGLSILAETGDKNGHILLAGAALAGADAIGLHELMLMQRYDETTRTPLFYAESYSFMAFLQGQMTSPQYDHFLTHLQQGQPLDRAVSLAMAVPHQPEIMDRLEAAWRRYAILQRQLVKLLLADADEPTSTAS